VTRGKAQVAKKRILILGGGFGGVYVAVHLGKMLSRAELEGMEIALVNRDNYIVFQPLLADAISGSVELSHVMLRSDGWRLGLIFTPAISSQLILSRARSR
jgi:NADH:ubiquinone reductase (H+-translocating)